MKYENAPFLEKARHYVKWLNNFAIRRGGGYVSIYGTLAIIGLIVLFLVDITMVVPFVTNQIIVSSLVFVFYLYLLYLIIFRKIF